MEYLALGVFCFVAALGAVWVLSRFDKPPSRDVESQSLHSVDFLFDGDELVDLSDAARVLIPKTDDLDDAWGRVAHDLQPRFPDLPMAYSDTVAQVPAKYPAQQTSDPAYLSARLVGDRLRLSLVDTSPAHAAHRHLVTMTQMELGSINRAADAYPFPVWLCRGDGTLKWANRAYHRLVAMMRSDTDTNNPPLREFNLKRPETKDEVSERVAISPPDSGETRWFSVSSVRTDETGILNYAIGIDAVVAAETAQRKFVQTLTKTFAQLSTGLAIFDRNRQLALFNPALIDLTMLPAEFLSGRPNLHSFFDRLREGRMMPEPKDYASWRQHIAELVIAASDGRYHETWTLPSGLTYRVTGRPHPDGAIAFLFEDISAEISLTRQFRAQLNLSQSVIDTLDEAICVFTGAGILTFSNSAFRTMWKLDPDSSFADMTVQDANRHWRSVAGDSPFWSELQDYMSDPRDRSGWFSDIAMADGTPVECRVAPLGGGATLVGFRLRPLIAAPDPALGTSAEQTPDQLGARR